MYKHKARQIWKAKKCRNGVPWTKEEANIAIQGLNETIRYIAKEYEPKNKG